MITLRWSPTCLPDRPRTADAARAANTHRSSDPPTHAPSNQQRSGCTGFAVIHQDFSRATALDRGPLHSARSTDCWVSVSSPHQGGHARASTAVGAIGAGPHLLALVDPDDPVGAGRGKAVPSLSTGPRTAKAPRHDDEMARLPYHPLHVTSVGCHCIRSSQTAHPQGLNNLEYLEQIVKDVLL